MSKVLDNFLKRSPLQILIIFTLLDCIAVGLYFLHVDEILPSRFFNISRDRGLGEIIQYLKYLVIIFILWSWYSQRSAKIIKAWIIFFIVLFLDDMLGIHEYVGKLILQFMPFDGPEGMRVKDIAEIAGFAMFEGAAAILIAIYFFKAEKDLQLYTIWLGVFLIPLIFAGLVLDSFGTALVEQIGEMLAASLVMYWVVRSRALGLKDKKL